MLLVFILLSMAPGHASAQSQVSQLKHAISFEETFERYPAPYDLHIHIQRIIPHFSADQLPTKCHTLEEKYATTKGAIDPNEGKALDREPGGLYFNLYYECLKYAFDLGFGLGVTREQRTENFRALVSSEVYEQMLAFHFEEAEQFVQANPSAAHTNEFYSFLHTPFSRLPENIKRDLLRHLLRHIAGPDVILKRLHLLGEETVFGQSLFTSEELIGFLLKSVESKRPTATTAEQIKNIVLLVRIAVLKS